MIFRWFPRHLFRLFVLDDFFLYFFFHVSPPLFLRAFFCQRFFIKFFLSTFFVNFFCHSFLLSTFFVKFLCQLLLCPLFLSILFPHFFVSIFFFFEVFFFTFFHSFFWIHVTSFLVHFKTKSNEQGLLCRSNWPLLISSGLFQI